MLARPLVEFILPVKVAGALPPRESLIDIDPDPLSLRSTGDSDANEFVGPPGRLKVEFEVKHFFDEGSVVEPP